MNSLNRISARVSPPSTPVPSRSNSLVGHVGIVSCSTNDAGHAQDAQEADGAILTAEPESYSRPGDDDHDYARATDEQTPLLEKLDNADANIRASVWHVWPRRIVNDLIYSLRWVLSTIAAPGVYLIACLYDENDNFDPLRQLRKLFGAHRGRADKLASDYHEDASLDDEKRVSSRSTNHKSKGKYATVPMRRPLSSGSSSSAPDSESDSEMTSKSEDGSQRADSPRRHSRSRTLHSAEEIAPSRRSIRIKLHNNEDLRQRKHRKSQSVSAKSSAGELAPADVSAQLKSPTSPAGALTKYPKTPAPPRPLIPRRQPSYIPFETPDPKHLKTLILDLDETLIHSMSRGGRMGSGHMVEVRLNTTYVGAGGQQSLGPQHPILYYVHKRPHCDEFLRKISQWFNLVVFTASVQEYADPVIDWLESEKKYFTGRYYRQHCTFRHGAFIKDVSAVEPDLSKVMILDNSPLSYMFHQDNAIPIQGWISDPTDNDLLHLVPLLEGLQYVSDVRALLALRGGEDGQHMTA